MKTMIKMGKVFREAADIIDELIALEPREEQGEDVEKETESVLGRFMLKMIELQQLQNEM
jgi:hypothetical protein